MRKLIIAITALIPLVIIAAGGIKEFSQDTLRFGSSTLGNRSLIFDYAPDGSSASLSVNPSNDEFTFNNKVNLTSGLDVGGALDVVGNYTSTNGNLTLTNGSLNATNGIISGMTITTPLKLDVKQDTEANLVTYAATASDGQIVFATDTQTMYQIIDNDLAEIGAGGIGTPSLYIFYDAEDEDIDNFTATGGTLSVNSTTPLSRLFDYKFIASAVNQYFDTPDFTLDPRQSEAYTTHAIKGLYRYTSGQYTLTAIDQSNNQVGDPLILEQSSTAEPFELLVTIPSTVTSIALRAENTTYSSSDTIYIDDIEFVDDAFETRDVYASTEWTAYTPTTQGLGTISNNNTYYRRVGDSLELMMKLTTGTTTAVEAQFGLPNGLSVDPITVSSIRIVGTMGYSAIADVVWAIAATGGDTYLNLVRYDATSSDFSVLNGTNIGNSYDISILATVPIEGWKDKANHVARQEERQQAHFVGSIEWQPTTGMEWTTGSTSITEFPDDVDADNNPRILKGLVTDTSSGLRPEFGISEGKKGSYVAEVRVVHSGTSTYSGGSANYELYINDGTSDNIAGQYYINAAPSSNYTYRGTSNFVYKWEEDSDFTNKTFKIKGRVISGGSMGLYPATHGLEISVYYYPPPEEKNVITTVLLPQSEENVFSARIANNGTASVISKNADFIESVNRTALGLVTVTFKSGFFTQVPSITAMSETTPSYNLGLSSLTASSVSVNNRNVESSAWIDSDFTIHVSRQGSDYKGTRVHVGSVPRNQVMLVWTTLTSDQGATGGGSWDTLQISDLGGQIIGSLASDQITLGSGDYQYWFSQMTDRCTHTYIRLYNATDTAEVPNSVGVKRYENDGSHYSQLQTSGTFSLSASKAIEVQGSCGSAAATTSWGDYDAAHVSNKVLQGWIVKLND